MTKPDFYNEETRLHLASTVSELIGLNIVPIINTNDAVSPPPLADEDLTGVSFASHTMKEEAISSQEYVFHFFCEVKNGTDD